jgi:hypothetical protein
MGLYVLGHNVVAVDGHELGLEPTAKDPGAFIAIGARQNSSPQRPVNMD